MPYVWGAPTFSSTKALPPVGSRACRLNVQTGLFTEIQAKGSLPLPRRGMSLTYDGSDLLVCFGGCVGSIGSIGSVGSVGSNIDGSLSVYSLRLNEWSQPQQRGDIPGPRTNHSAAFLSPHVILLFGGCYAQGLEQGKFYNDAHVLDTRTFTWTRPMQLNPAPAPRYHHTCCCIHGRAFLFGGINTMKTFGDIVVVDTRFATDVDPIADALLTMMMSNSRPSSGSGSGIMSTNVTSEATSQLLVRTPSEELRTQLQGLMYKRNMEEQQQQTLHRAEQAEQRLVREAEAVERLQRDCNQLQLLQEEAEGQAAEARAGRREADARAARDAAALEEARLGRAAALARLAERDREVEASRVAQESLVKELGMMASR